MGLIEAYMQQCWREHENMYANGSEVARLRLQIDEEYEAAHKGLCGLATGVARHEFIHARMERINGYYKRLVLLVGEDDADELLCHVSDEQYACWVRATNNAIV